MHGIEATYQVAIPDGKVIQLILLQHIWLETRNMKLKPKLLTCAAAFAQKHDLGRKGLTEACPRSQDCHMRPQARLSVILGMDVMHVTPQLIEEFRDRHGFLALYACTLSNSLITMSNRQYPYTPAEAQSALSQNTSNFSVFTTFMEDEVTDCEDLPLNTIFHGATEDYPIATRLGSKEPTLKFLDCPEESKLPASRNLATSIRPPAFGDQLTVAGPPSTSSSTMSSSGSPSTSSSTTSSSGSPSMSSTTAASVATAPPTTTSTTLSEPGAAENHPTDDTEHWSEGEEIFDAVHLEAQKADIDKFLDCGVVSKILHQMLEVFTAPAAAPEHMFKHSCKTCSKCKICFETGGQTFMEKLQTEAFKAHIWIIPNTEGDLAKYKYMIKDIQDPQAIPLPDN